MGRGKQTHFFPLLIDERKRFSNSPRLSAKKERENAFSIELYLSSFSYSLSGLGLHAFGVSAERSARSQLACDRWRLTLQQRRLLPPRRRSRRRWRRWSMTLPLLPPPP